MWLNASIFCKRNNWGELLKNGVNSFVKSSMEEKTVNSYSVELNFSECDHVRLAILLEKHNVLQVGEAMTRYFSDFFENSGFDSPDLQLPIDRFFLPFPCNSIRYGLYNAFSWPYNQVLVNIQRELSDIIIQSVSEEIVDEELLVTLGFYLHSMWLERRKLIAEFEGDDPVIHFYPVDNHTAEGKFVEARIHTRYLLIREMLEDIYRVVRNVDDPSCGDCPAWLQQWSGACDRYTNSTHHNTNEVPALISRCLGLTPIANFMVFYFLKQTFGEREVGCLSLNE